MAGAGAIRLLLLGAPGAGKGTQMGRLLQRFPGLQAVASGDLLRREIAAGSPLGEQAAAHIAAGRLLPDALVSSAILDELARRRWLHGGASWLLDGFPRTVAQAQELDAALERADAALTLVVEVAVPEDVILDRIQKRFVHVPSGRVYNLDYNPPCEAGRDDVTGEPLSRRPDDTPEVFYKRMQEYAATAGPLKEHYARQGILRTVRGPTSDIVFPQLERLVQAQLGT